MHSADAVGIPILQGGEDVKVVIAWTPLKEASYALTG